MVTFRDNQNELKELISNLDKRITDLENKIDKIPTGVTP